MKDLRELIEAVRPHLPGLPPEVEVVPWERVRGVEEHHLGLAFRSRPALSLHPDLEGEALERVLLHELLHLAEPLLSEPWVQALEPVLHHALRNGLPPRDVPSLAWLSLEEASSRLLPDLSEEEETDPLWFPGRLGPFYRALGVVPERELAEDPLYLFQQVSGGLPFGTTAWALERLWPPPAMTRREAALAIAWWAALATEKAWAEVERLLGRDGEMAFTGGPWEPPSRPALVCPRPRGTQEAHPLPGGCRAAGGGGGLRAPRGGPARGGGGGVHRHGALGRRGAGARVRPANLEVPRPTMEGDAIRRRSMKTPTKNPTPSPSPLRNSSRTSTPSPRGRSSSG